MAKQPLALEVYFDYLCPYAYRAAEWLRRLDASSEMQLIVSWRYFSLEQANSQNGPEWKVWEQPEVDPTRGLRAFRAAEAARRQGAEAYTRFHFALLKARHEEERDIADPGVLKEVAVSVGMDPVQFERDFADRKLLAAIAKDHCFAVETLGVFGTPTLVFQGGQTIFLKLSTLVPSEETEAMFGELYNLATQRSYIQEVKRPQRP